MNTIEKEAKLFEAGKYPDKNLEITVEDLDAIIANAHSLPLKIEHTDTPLDGVLGTVSKLYRKGTELFGKILFNIDAWKLLSEAGARKLSVALTPDKKRITEVSLVRFPRVADAAVFKTDNILFVGEIPANPEADAMADIIVSMRADNKIARYRREGKITKASEPFARAIFEEAGTTVRFEGARKNLADLFEEFLKALPAAVDFSELTTCEHKEETPELLKRLGVTADQVRKYNTREVHI